MEPIDSLATSDWFKDYDSLFEMFDEEMRMGAVEAAALSEAVVASNTWSSASNPYETTYYAAMAPPATPLSDYYYTAATFAATSAPQASSIVPTPTIQTTPLAVATPSVAASTSTTTTAPTATLVPPPPCLANTTNLCHQGVTYHYATALATTCSADVYDLNQYYNQYQEAPLLDSSSCDNNPLIVHCNSASTTVTNSASDPCTITNNGAASPQDNNKCKKKMLRSRGTSLLAQPSPKSATSKQLSRLEYTSRLCVQIEHSYATTTAPVAAVATTAAPIPTTTTTTRATTTTTTILIHK